MSVPERPAFPRPFLWGAVARAIGQEHAATGEVVPLLASLHLNACRIAADWARIEPTPGAWDTAALAGLRALLQALREADIEPVLTLHDGNDPQWFADTRGWLRRDAVQLFCRFVVKIVEEVGDLVTLYVTIDGPTRLARNRVVAACNDLGRAHAATLPPPTREVRGILRALLHAHGAARRTLHEATPHHGPRPLGSPQAGLAHHVYSFVPCHTASPLDRLAVARADYFWNTLPLRILADGRLRTPLGHGEYLPELDNSLDFVGITPGPRTSVTLTPVGMFHGSALPRDGAVPGPAHALWLTHLLRRVATPGKPVVITGDGLTAAQDGEHATFLAERLVALALAREGGVDVRGYLYDPLVDASPATNVIGAGLATVDAFGVTHLRPGGTLLGHHAAAGLPPHGLAR